jgi:hypothetical protein
MKHWPHPKWLGLSFLLVVVPLKAQTNPTAPRPIITNSGIASGMLESHQGSAHFYGVVGQSTAVVVAQDQQNLVHHGMLHPLILTSEPIPVSSVGVYPNPTDGPLSVLWNRSDAQPEWVEVVDLNGSPVPRMPYDPELSLNNLPAAPYSLRFIQGKTLLGVAEIILTR